MSALRKLDARINGDVVEVAQCKMRRRIVVRPEINASGEQCFVSDMVYEPVTSHLVSVPVSELSSTVRLSEAFKCAGIPVSDHDEIRDVLMNLPHMRGASA